MDEAKAEFAQFRADVESEAAKASIAAARTALRQAENTTEVISDLQARNAALRARYDGLRASAGSGLLPTVPAAAPSTSPVAGSPLQPDAASRCLAAIRWGDEEIAKFRELWLLQLRNAGVAL